MSPVLDKGTARGPCFAFAESQEGHAWEGKSLVFSREPD